MGTRARIALKLEDNSYISVYQHWNGYPAYLGFQLCVWWRDPKKVKQAILLGDGSEWNFIIGEKIDFEDLSNPQRNVQNVYYHRDRGDDWESCKYQVHQTESELLNEAFECWEEYLYVFKNGLWYYCEPNCDKLQPLWDQAIKDYFDWLNRSKPQYPN